MERKHTKFQTCERHSSWRAYGRYRLAEFFCEGGNGSHCEGGICKCWPGRDIFCAEICDGGELDYNWDRLPDVVTA